MPVEATQRESDLWLLEDLVPGTGVNNLSLVFEVDGRLEPARLRRAVNAAVRKYRSLRTVYQVGDTGLVREALEPSDVDVEIETLPTCAGNVRADLTGFIARPFAMDGTPLVRAGLFRQTDREVCCLAIHHLVFDAVSTTTLLADIVTGYDDGARAPADLGTEEHLPEVVPTEQSLTFWRRHLDGFRADQLGLWCERPHADQPTLLADTCDHALSADAAATLKKLQREFRAPKAAILLAAYYLLLARHGAGPDIVVGFPANVRGTTAPNAVGYHVNMLPLRVQVDPDGSFRDLVGATRAVFFEALTHPDVPAEKFFSDVRRAHTSWRNTLFRHIFNYVPHDFRRTFTIGGASARQLLVPNGFSKYDLEFFISESADTPLISAVCYADVLARSDVELMLRRYDALLAGLDRQLDDPVGDLPLWSEPDRQAIEGARAAGAGPAGVLAAIRAHAEAAPSAVAIRHGDRAVSYQELWESATATADRLTVSGVTSGDLVVVPVDRGPELVAAILGGWLVGAVCRPVDAGDTGPEPAMPVLAQSSPGGYLARITRPDGKPDHQLIDHRRLGDVVTHLADELRVTPTDTVLWLSPPTSGRSVLELCLPLVSGGRLVVPPPAADRDGELLARLLAEHQVRIVHGTPSLLRLLLPHVGDGLAGTRVLCGGEQLAPALARRLMAAGCELHAAHQPAAEALYLTSRRVDCETDAQLRLGRPIGHTRVLVTDPRGRELPIGLAGELCVTGTGLDTDSAGAEWSGEHATLGRYRRTGDLVRWCPDGTLELAGRAPAGAGVDPTVVESVLLGHPEVVAAAVVDTLNTEAESALIAFVAAPAAAELPDRLRDHLAARLPVAAVPARFVVLDRLLVAADQRLDRDRLADLAADLVARDADPVARPAESAPPDEVVDSLVLLWRELLGSPDPAPESNFFLSGGNSLLGAQLVQRVKKLTGIRLRLADLFANPTPAELGELLRSPEFGVESIVL